MARGHVRTRVVALGVWVGGLLVVGVGARVVALPEHCRGVTAEQRRGAVASTVEWYERNQNADGSFLYRVDVETGEELPGYSWVRHAGALLALEQAVHAGFTEAGPVAERGWQALDAHVQWFGDRAGIVEGDRVTGGGTALALVALGERREASGATDRDPLMRAMARQLASMVRPDGTVAEAADATPGPSGGIAHPDSISRFTTGEVAFALARMERLMPGEGWGDDVRSIVHYLALDKAVAEGFVPDMADHWGAYALAEVVRWPRGGALDDVERAWARKQMGMISSMIRFEAQRSNDGVDRWLRGRTSIGSAVGTHGESMQGWVQVAAADPELRPLLRAGQDRLDCNAGLLVRRQISDADAANLPDPSVAAGTWTWFGITQVDDQQHAMSALLAADLLLGDDPSADGPGILPRRAPTPQSVWLAIGLVLLAVDPLRVARRTRRVATGPTVLGAAGSVAVLGLTAAVGGAALRALDVSVPTAAVAAGAVLALGVIVTALGDWWRRGEDSVDALVAGAAQGTRWSLAVVPVAVPVVLRPVLLVLALALGAGGRTVTVVGAAALALALGVLTRRWAPEPSTPTKRTGLAWHWGEQLTSAITLVLAVALIVDGVYAV